MNNREIEICDVNEDAILSLMGEILELDLQTVEDMVTDDEARETMREIYTLIAELGEKKYRRPQAATYPENYADNAYVLLYSWEASKNAEYPLYWSEAQRDWVAWDEASTYWGGDVSEKPFPVDGGSAWVSQNQAIRVHQEFYFNGGE